MRRASTLAAAALAATGAMALAGAASAQSSAQSAPSAGQAQGLRYLSWQGRGETMAPTGGDAAQATPVRTDLRRPNPVIPHGGFAATAPAAPHGLSPAPGPARRTLTPANAWLQPRPVAPEPGPVPAPASPPPARVAAAAPPPSAPAPRPPAQPEYLPDQGGRGQPAPAEAVYPSPARIEDGPTAADPMAPRRDAPIFRMRQTAPASPPPELESASPPQEAPRAEAARSDAPAEPRRVMEVSNSGERPSREGARYYSVHRQNGREPDTMVMPEPTYVDALVVTMTETPATQDLAEPAAGPTLIRDRNGSMRPVPASSDGDHQ